jgi:hypothetical protein
MDIPIYISLTLWSVDEMLLCTLDPSAICDQHNPPMWWSHQLQVSLVDCHSRLDLVDQLEG